MNEAIKYLSDLISPFLTHPKEVSISRTVDEMGVFLTLKVHKDDMGTIIGRAGTTIEAIRRLLRLFGSMRAERINLKVLEPDGATQQKRDLDDTIHTFTSTPVSGRL